MSWKFDNLTKVSLLSFFAALYFYLPILTIYFQQKGLNFVQINSLWGIITATIFLAEIPTGLLADKIGRKPSIVIALLLQLIGEILFLFSQNYLYFVLTSIIAGVGFAFQSGCLQALVYDDLKEKGQHDTMKLVTGRIGAYTLAGGLLGALGSSFIVAQLTPFRIQLAIILTIISVGVALCISFFLHEPKRKYNHVEQHPLTILKQSLVLIKNNPSLKRLIAFGLFTTPFINYLRNLQPPYFQLSGVPTYWLGISLAIGGILAMGASKYAYKIEQIFGVGLGTLIATALPALFYILMGVIVHPLAAVVLFILGFSSMSFQDPLLADYNNRHIPSEIRATVLSLIGMFSSIYITVVGLGFGWIADHSISYAFLSMGALVLTGAILFRINENHVKVINV